MKLKIQYNKNSIIHKTTVEVMPDDYIQKIKEILFAQNNEISKLIKNNNGPYNPEIKLSFNNIELNNMFKINKYFIKDGETLEIDIEEKKSNTKKTSYVKNLICTTCGKEQPSEDYLKYHPGKLSAAEWVYGLTVKWKWSCCKWTVSTPDKCFHPEGCEYGICPECRKDCACYSARKIRKEEEGNF